MQIHVIFDVWCTCSTKVSLASFFIGECDMLITYSDLPCVPGVSYLIIFKGFPDHDLFSRQGAVHRSVLLAFDKLGVRWLRGLVLVNGLNG